MNKEELLTQEDLDFIEEEIKTIYWIGFKRGLILGMGIALSIVGWLLFLT